MAKAIKWQIPFATNNPTNLTRYRIDIYAEGYSGTPIQLTGGAQPFTTSENDDKNFFAPVRSQTGTIQVCTRMPNGSTLDVKSLMPTNNIAHPVLLINLSNSNAIEWQGFMSCESYSQGYTQIPENFSFPVLSVLEAMGSVDANTSRVNGLRQTRLQLYDVLTELDRQIGMPSPLFANIYYSKASVSFMTKMIDATILYDIKEYNDEESHTYVVSGLSCKDVLTRICTYMGWCCREKATDIFFFRMCEDGNLYTQPLSKFGGTFAQYQDRTEVALTTSNMSGLVWMGTSHKRNIRQGAKSVEVIANLEKYDLKLGLPDFPTNDMVHAISNLVESYAQMNTSFNNTLTFSNYLVVVRETSGGYDVFTSGSTDVETAYDHCALNPNCVLTDYYKRKTTGTQYVCTRDVAAFFAMLKFSDGEGGYDWWTGLYITTANEIYATNQHAPSVFKIDSLINYRLMDGLLRFKVSAMTVTNGGTTLTQFMGIVQMRLRFGVYYWNGSAWTTTSTFFDVNFANSPVQDEDSGYVLEIPVTSSLPLYGSVSIEIRGSMSGGTTYTPGGSQPSYYVPFYDLYIYELELGYEAPEYITENDRSENKYYRLLGTDFRDEISISTELASNLNNRPSPSLVMDSDTKAMTMMNYNKSDGNQEPRRPEQDLLNRLAIYYGAARQTLELIVKHPTAAALPLLKLNGIDDNKKYLPLAESRNWKTEECTLTCFETPN